MRELKDRRLELRPITAKIEQCWSVYCELVNSLVRARVTPHPPRTLVRLGKLLMALGVLDEFKIETVGDLLQWVFREEIEVSRVIEKAKQAGRRLSHKSHMKRAPGVP